MSSIVFRFIYFVCVYYCLAQMHCLCIMRKLEEDTESLETGVLLTGGDEEPKCIVQATGKRS